MLERIFLRLAPAVCLYFVMWLARFIVRFWCYFFCFDENRVKVISQFHVFVRFSFKATERLTLMNFCWWWRNKCKLEMWTVKCEKHFASLTEMETAKLGETLQWVVHRDQGVIEGFSIYCTFLLSARWNSEMSWQAWERNWPRKKSVKWWKKLT